MDKAENRRKLLQDSYQYQQFDRDADEVEGWIREKLAKTQDESYKVCKENKIVWRNNLIREAYFKVDFTNRVGNLNFQAFRFCMRTILQFR